MTDFAARRRIMVDTQVRPSDVTKFPVIDAMLTVPRQAFVPVNLREAAYLGDNLDLGGGRVLLAPRILAKMLDGLDIRGDDLVLDLGCGLGYSSAVIARMAEAVVAVEEDATMAAEAQTALAENAADNVAVIAGALVEGAPQHGPYDAIVIEGAIERLPGTIEQQLREGGRIAAIFMDGALGVCRIGYKIDGTLNWRFAFNATAPVLGGFENRPAFVL